MFLFTILAKPSPGNGEASDAGGAFVNVWVDFKEQSGAEHIARYYIVEAGWVPGETQEVSIVTEDDYPADDEEAAYFLQAGQDGSCLVFHEWPADADDADDDLRWKS
ncbi:MAG: hypothetical protein HQ592_10985 [Planctomycetes bacterium]|nr:hypothetical protein [Planctomycetota bacterium]